MSIRWKILLSFLAVVIIPSIFLHRYTITFFDRYTRTALEKEMGAYALLAGQHYRAMVLDIPESQRESGEARFQKLISVYGPDLMSRIRIISLEGIVLFDSHDDSTAGMDFSARPEVSKALGGRYGARWQLTEDRGYVYYFIAIPLQDESGELVGAVMVSRHTGPITQAIGEIMTEQSRALIIAGIFAVAAAAALAFTITRPLRRLTRAAGEIGRGTARDIPRDLRGRSEIGILADSLRRMTSELEKRNRYNRDFISETLHELKTPLTAIIGAAEILESREPPPESSRRRFAANIRLDARRMNSLVGELAGLTRLDLETTTTQRETVNYPDFVLGVLSRADAAFERPRAELKTELSEKTLPVAIVPDRIEQVILNLLENAFRYTPPEGTVTVSVSPLPDRGVLTSVRDTGPGISPANREKIFERFFTTEDRNGSQPYGSGLGLAIARSIVEKHGGQIEATLPPDGGTLFTFTLPLSEKAGGPAQSH